MPGGARKIVRIRLKCLRAENGVYLSLCGEKTREAAHRQGRQRVCEREMERQPLTCNQPKTSRRIWYTLADRG